MADVNFNRGYKESISQTSIVPFKEGSISIAEDSQELYIDGKDNKRIRITDVIDITNITDPTLIAGKIYINGNKLQKVENDKLVDVSSVGNSVLNVDDQINRLSNTEGTLTRSVGKVGDFIIDSKGNIGIVKEVTKSSTTLQIVSMNGEENQKLDYYIYVGDVKPGKCIGTINDPYVRDSQFPDDLITKLKSDQIVVINCVNEFTFYNSISNWRNVVINGNGFKINFLVSNDKTIESCSNIKLINCDINGIKTVSYCEAVTLENCIINECYFTANEYLCFENCKQSKNKTNIAGSSDNIDIVNCNFKYVNLNGIYSSNSNINIINSTINSFHTNNFDERDESTVITIKNSEINDMNIVSEIHQLNLISGKCTNNLAQSILATNINLGTFEFATTPIFGDSSNIIDRVGLSSKQVYDEKTRNYGNTKKNLESHLDAIDKSLDNINDSISSLTEEGSGLAEAYISKDSFKIIEELDNKQWRAGDIVKYYGDSIITIENTIDLTPIQYEDIQVPVTSESGTIYEDYISLTFPVNNASYYCSNGEKVNVTHNMIVSDKVNPFTYTFEIYSVDKNKFNDNTTETGYFKARFKKSDVNAEDEITNDLSKFVDCSYVKSLSVSKNDRLVRLSDGWDKLSASSDDAGNYYIVDNFSTLSYIKSDLTRPVGTLGYVREDDKVYKWFYNEDSNLYEWVEFSSGSGGGGGTGSSYILQYCSPSDRANPLYKYIYQANQKPDLFYNEADKKLEFSYYYSNSQAAQGTYSVLFNGNTITSGTLLKGVQTITIDLTKTTLQNGEYSIVFYLSNNQLSILDKSGNIVADSLKYNVSKSEIALTYRSGNNDYNFNTIKTINDENHEIIINLSKSNNINISSFMINDVEQVITTANNQEIAYKYLLTKNINPFNIKINYTITGSIKDYVYEDNKLIYALAENSLYLYDQEFSSEITLNSKIKFSAKLLSNLSNTGTIIYWFDDESATYDNVFTKTIENLSTNLVNTLTEIELEHKFSEPGNHTIHYAFRQNKDGVTYDHAGEPVLITIISIQDSTGPITNTFGDQCLLMNFDRDRCKAVDINKDGWVSSVNDYKIKFNNLFNNQSFVGYEVTDDSTSNLCSEYNGNKSQFVRFFGDTYGNIVEVDKDGNEKDFDINTLNKQMFKVGSSDTNQGYTIEILFRNNFTGDLNELALRIGSLLNISIDTIHFFDDINFVNNDWLHVTFIVNNYKNEDIKKGTQDVLSAKGTVLPHMAIYVNGIIAKLKYSTLNPSLNSGTIEFNRNVIDGKSIYGLTDLRAFRIYKRPLTPAEIVQNYHSCIKNEAIRESEINKNNLSNFSGITEVYFVRNSGSDKMPDRYASKRKSNVKSTTFADMNLKTNKADSKSNVVNCTMILVTKLLDETHVAVYKNVETTLQGTSTLKYIVKNYKIKLYDEKCKKLKIALGNPIDGIDAQDRSYRHTWLPEYVYTLKCDYMESSHMNNTGIARFINDELYKGYSTPHRTPSQIDGNDDNLRIIIDGFPCILYQVDDNDFAEYINDKILDIENKSTSNDSDINYDSLQINDIKNNSNCKLYGSYMFNLDKDAAANYGFDLEDETTDEAGVVTKTPKYPYLQSFEINANDSAGAGAFLPYDLTRKDDTGNAFKSEYDYYIDTYESRHMYDERDVLDETEIISIGDYDCVKIDNALNEYVVPGFPVYRKEIDDTYTDVTLTYNNKPTTGMEYYRPVYDEDNMCFNGIIQLINFLNNSKLNKTPSNFEKFVNKDFAIDYFIMTMSVGMVDNLGKNLMMNSWNIDSNGIAFNPKYINPEILIDSDKIDDIQKRCYWYPSFYDLDTCLGLNNFGKEDVTIDAEPIIDKLSGYTFKSYKQIYKNTPDADEKYIDLNVVINGQQIEYSKFKYLPDELLELVYNIENGDEATINKLNTEIANYSWIIILNDDITSVSISNNLQLKSNDWFVFDVKDKTISTFTESKVNRYSLYSTAYSSLWNTLLNNFSATIYNDYTEIRNKKLNVDNLLDKLAENTFDNIPKNYYNYNAQIKYLTPCSEPGVSTQAISDYCAMCNGDREIKVKYWLKNRLNFVDTMITNDLDMPNPQSDVGQSMTIFPYSNGSKSLYVQTMQPQYVSIQNDTNSKAIRKYVNRSLQDNINYQGVEFNVNVKQQVQTHITGSKNMINFYSFGLFNPGKISLDNMLYLNSISIGTKQLADDKIDSISFTSDIDKTYAFNNIELHIKNGNFSTLDLSRCLYLNTLDLSGCTNITTLKLPQSARIKSIDLTNCSNLTELELIDLFQLESIDLTGCNKLNKLTIKNAEKLKTLDVKKLQLTDFTLYNTGISTIELNAISGTNSITNLDIRDDITKIAITKCAFKIDTLDLSNCPLLTEITITEDTGFKNLLLPKINRTDVRAYLNILASSMSAIGYNDKLTANCFDFGQYKGKLSSDLSDLGTTLNTTDTQITFPNSTVTISNLVTQNVSFKSMSKLTTLSNCKLYNMSRSEVFRGTAITSIVNTDLKITSNSLYLYFMEATNVSDDVIKKVIDSVTNKANVKHLVGMFKNTKFKNTTLTSSTINFTGFTGLTDLTCMFSGSNIIYLSSATIIPTNATSTTINVKEMFANCASLKTVPTNLFPNKISNAQGLFYNCTNLTQCANINTLTNLEKIDGIFYNCSRLAYNINILNSSTTTNNFKYISTQDLTKLTSASCAYYNSGIIGTTIETSGSQGITQSSCFPDDFFKNNTRLTNIEGMFCGCTKITTILPDKFINTNVVTRAAGLFAYSGVTGHAKRSLFKVDSNSSQTLLYLGFDGSLTNKETTSESILWFRITDKSWRGAQMINKIHDIEVMIEIPLYGLFEGTNITTIDIDFFYDLTELRSISCIFANTNQFNCFTSLVATANNNKISGLFDNNTKLTNVSYAFANTKISLPFDSNLFINNSNILYMDGTFAYNRLIKTSGQLFDIIKMAHLKSLRSCQALYAGNMYYELNGNLTNDDGTLSDNNLNNVFKLLPNLTDTSFMFFKCGLSFNISTDSLFTTAIKNTRHMFNQCYYDSNSMSYLMYDLYANGTDDYNGRQKPSNHVALNDTSVTYFKTNINAFGNINGKVPKYLFRDCINLESCSYMFAGTCLTGEIPSTIFDISTNHIDKEIEYSGQKYLYPSPENTNINIVGTDVYFYTDSNGDYIFDHYDSDQNVYIMKLYTTETNVQRYSLCKGWKYTEDAIKLTGLTKTFSQLTSVAYMFAMCTHLRNADPISEPDYTTKPVNNILSKVSTIPFVYNGYYKTNDTTKDRPYFVIDDIQKTFRRYNPDTDDIADINGNQKSKFIIDNNNWILYEAASINTEDDISTNYKYVYMLHPNIFVNLNKLTTVSGFIAGCNELQGCLPNNIFKYNTNLTYANRFCADCYNMYGFYSDTKDNNSLYDMFYNENMSRFSIKELSYMFYNCRQLGDLRLKGQTESACYSYVEPAIRESTNNRFTRGFLAWHTSTGNFLLKNITTIRGMFAYCQSLQGYIPKNMLTVNTYINSSLDIYGCFGGDIPLATNGGYSGSYTNVQSLGYSYVTNLYDELINKYQI